MPINNPAQATDADANASIVATINRREFIGAALTTATGFSSHATAADARTLKHGWNVSSPTHYNGGSLYINRLLDAAVSGDTTPHGYPPGGAGKSTAYLVISENAHEWWSYKPGVYRIVGTGTGARVQVTGSAFREQSIVTSMGEPFRLSVTLPPLAAPTGEAAITFTRVQHLRVSVTGGTSAMGDLAVLHADDEADFAAGKVFTAEARSDLATASRGPLRPMGLMQTVSGWVKDPGDLPSDADVGLTNNFIQYPGHAPGTNRFRLPSPEKLAKLANETGNPLWVSLWVMASDATLKAFFDRLAAAYPSGDVYVEGGNEVWNNAYTANSGFLATQYGRPEYQNTGLVDASSETAMRNAAHFALRCFRAAEARSAFNGRGRVKRVFNCQLGWPERSFIGLDYVDPGIVAEGRKFGTLIDSPCVATYFSLCPDALYSGGNTGRGITQLPRYGIGLSRRRIIHQRIYENGPANDGNAALWFEKAWKNSIDNTAGYIKAYQTRLAAAGYALLRFSYEGGWSHDDVPAFDLGTERDDPKKPAGLPGLCMAYQAETGALTPTRAVVGGRAFDDTGEALESWFSDGDLVQVGYNGTTGITVSRTFACRVSGGALQLFATQADHAARKVRSGGADGPVLVVNTSRMTAFNRFLLGQLWANRSVDGSGVTVLDYYHDKMVQAGITHGCAFLPVGGATSAFRDFTGTKPWAYKPHGYHAPDTPAMTWLRGKG
jgi:hypothetical protein